MFKRPFEKWQCRVTGYIVGDIGNFIRQFFSSDNERINLRVGRTCFKKHCSNPIEHFYIKFLMTVENVANGLEKIFYSILRA